MLLLNEDQIKLFSYIPKPTISYMNDQEKNTIQLGKSEINKYDILFSKKVNEFEKAVEAYKAFQNL